MRMVVAGGVWMLIFGEVVGDTECFQKGGKRWNKETKQLPAYCDEVGMEMEEYK